MKAKTKQAILFAALAFGAVWNCLCLAGVFPVDKWPVSLGIVCAGNLFTLIPLLFQPAIPKEEPPAYTAERRKKDQITAGALITLSAAWVITMIVCLFVS